MVLVGSWDMLPDSPLGITAGINDTTAYTGFDGTTGAGKQFITDVTALGASRIRFTIARAVVESTTTEGHFDWSGTDARVLAAARAGIRVTLVVRGFPAASVPSWASVGSPCDSSGKTYTSPAAYIEYAVALVKRYSGDGNPANITFTAGKFVTVGAGGSGPKLQVDCIEIGDEEFDLNVGASGCDNGGCSDGLRYAFYVRQIAPAMRSAGWVPRGNFGARIGKYGNVTRNPAHVKDLYHKCCNPNWDTGDPLYSTWNPSQSGRSIFGFDPTYNCRLLDYATFHNHSDVYTPLGGTPDYTHGQELDDIRAILDANGNTDIPIWCTKFGESGPAQQVYPSGVSAAQMEQYQATFYAANPDGSGTGALNDLRNHGAQHVDLATIDFLASACHNPPYLGDQSAIACAWTGSGTPTGCDGSVHAGYTRFQAFCTIQRFFALDNGAWAAKAWPAGFASGPAGGESGGTLSVPPGALPGMRLVNGVSNLLFGTQQTVDFGTTHTVVNTAAIQAQFKQAGFTVMRLPVSNGATTYSDATLDARLAACMACGCVPLIIIGHDAGESYAQHVVTYVGSRCLLYEFYNEPDLNVSISGVSDYIAKWNLWVPTLQAINPSAAFGGPALGVVANFSSWITPWLNATVTSGVLPAFVSFHDYPCGAQPTQSICATKAPNIGKDAASLRTLIVAALGSTNGNAMPIGVTEWNIDWHNPPVSYANQANTANAAFVNQWYTGALDSMAQNGVALACQFDAAGGAESGEADLISTTSPYPPQDGFSAMAAEITKYLGGSSPPPPVPGSLVGSFARAGAGTVNLSTEAGTGDWAHWGFSGTTQDHNASGGSQISDVSVLGSGVAVQNPGTVAGFTWTGGTPNASATNTHTGLKVIPPAVGR